MEQSVHAFFAIPRDLRDSSILLVASRTDLDLCNNAVRNVASVPMMERQANGQALGNISLKKNTDFRRVAHCVSIPGKRGEAYFLHQDGRVFQTLSASIAATVFDLNFSSLLRFVQLSSYQ